MSIYVIILFFLLRNKVLIPFLGGIYFFVELGLMCCFGIVAYLLPPMLLFPNTTKVVFDGMFDTLDAFVQDDAAIKRGIDKMEEDLYAERSLAGALNSLPDTIYDSEGKAFRISYRNYGEVGYESADGERAVLRSNDDMGEYHW